MMLVLLMSCKEAIKNEKVVATDELVYNEVEILEEYTVPEVTKNILIKTDEDLLGYWVGKFDSNMSVYEEGAIEERENGDFKSMYKRITFSIDEIKNNIVKGHSVVSGMIRPFEGKLIKINDEFKIEVSEPGDDPFDGFFKMVIKESDSIMNGEWRTEKLIEIDRRRLTLKKRLFEYNPDNQLDYEFVDQDKMIMKNFKDEFDDKTYEYITEAYFTNTDKIFEFNASVDLLTKEFVENLVKADILLLRNSIYARHGYSFKNRALRYYFEFFDWYMPIFVDVSDKFTEIELKNIELLLRYEDNAEEYYDRFGR